MRIPAINRSLFFLVVGFCEKLRKPLGWGKGLTSMGLDLGGEFLNSAIGRKSVIFIIKYALSFVNSLIQ